MAGAVIVSGLADGLDSAGHQAAVGEGCPHHRGDGRPHRPDLPRRQPGTPPGHREAGRVISEYPPESEPVGAVGFCGPTPPHRGPLRGAGGGGIVLPETFSYIFFS